MAKTKANAAKGGSLFDRAVDSLVSALGRLPQKRKAQQSASPRQTTGKSAATGTSRPAKLTTDIPIDIIERTYTPTQTGMKAGFRASGADQSRDQEFAGGYADDERFKDEDRYTNKSGDPRIGTHGRAYEPGEK